MLVFIVCLLFLFVQEEDNWDFWIIFLNEWQWAQGLLKIQGQRMEQVCFGNYMLCFNVVSFVIQIQQIHLQKLMLSYKPVVLIPANENLLANSNQLDGPFLVSRDKAHDFKCFLKNAQWSMIQMAKYLAFIEENTKKIQGKAHKHLWGIYQEMGKYITTRNFRQVKSYHQKMVQKYNTIPQIISFHLINYPTIIPILEKQKQSLKILSINSQHSIQNIENIKTLIPTTESYLNESNQNILLKKEQQWKQCHQLFISWTNKLKNLTMMYV